MSDPLLKCSKCGAVMMYEDYHQYGWYLDGKRVEACPPEGEEVKVGREDLKRVLTALEEVKHQLAGKHEFQRLRAALEVASS